MRDRSTCSSAGSSASRASSAGSCGSASRTRDAAVLVLRLEPALDDVQRAVRRSCARHAERQRACGSARPCARARRAALACALLDVADQRAQTARCARARSAGHRARFANGSASAHRSARCRRIDSVSCSRSSHGRMSVGARHSESDEQVDRARACATAPDRTPQPSVPATGPTHAGQPCSHGHVSIKPRARRTSSSRASNTRGARPTPPGMRSYRKIVGSKPGPPAPLRRHAVGIAACRRACGRRRTDPPSSPTRRHGVQRVARCRAARRSPPARSHGLALDHRLGHGQPERRRVHLHLGQVAPRRSRRSRACGT